MAGVNQAYDLELFRPREPHLYEVKSDAKTARDTRRRSRKQLAASVAVSLVIAILAMALVASLITYNVKLTEMNKALSDGQARLNALQSEKVRLTSELAGLTSPERINEFALANGMQPIDSSQIYYIHANEEDAVTLAEEESGWFSRAWATIVGVLS